MDSKPHHPKSKLCNNYYARKAAANIKRKMIRLEQNLFVQSLARTAVLFGQNTTLHGVNHIVDDIQQLRNKQRDNNHQKILRIISLIIWTASCLSGAIFALFLMLLVWVKFQNTPTITTVETNNYPISNIQFPAVNLCNLNKVYAPATENITTRLLAKGFNRENITIFLSKLSLLIDHEYINDKTILEIDRVVMTEMNYTVESLMLELMQPCATMVSSCVWLGRSVPCERLFRVSKSADGYCCAFNSRALRRSLEVNANDPLVQHQLNAPVYRVSGFGEFVGLHAYLHTEIEHYLGYVDSYYGIKVLINEPEDFPETSVSTVLVQPSFDVSISVIPSIVVSQDSIRSLPLRQRNCLFDDERILKTTDNYGFQSCISECVVKEVTRICHCTPYYYPYIHMAKSRYHVHQCSLRNVNCLRENRHIFSSIKPDEVIIGYNNTKLEGMNCNCYPSCTEQSYEVEAIHCRRAIDGLFPLSNRAREEINETEPKYTGLKVFFKDISCIKYRRDMFMTWDELFATFGGIFGLCVGGSILSLIEMIYFFTFRLYGHAVQPANTPDEKQMVKVSSKNYGNYKSLQSSYADAMKKIKPGNNSIVIISEDNMTQYGYFN